MNIPEAKYTVGDKIWVTLLQGGEDERETEGIIHSAETSAAYGVPEVRYTIFVLDEDCCYSDFTEEDHIRPRLKE